MHFKEDDNCIIFKGDDKKFLILNKSIMMFWLPKQKVLNYLCSCVFFSNIKCFLQCNELFNSYLPILADNFHTSNNLKKTEKT